MQLLPHFAAVLAGPIAVWVILNSSPIYAEGHDPRDTATILEICSKCHGLDGISVSSEIPNLRGQDFQYLLNQLRRMRALGRNSDEKSGSGNVSTSAFSPIQEGIKSLSFRHSKAMSDRLLYFTDLELDEIAHWYADMPCSLESPKNPISTKGVYWCTVCHGSTPDQRVDGTPILHGQKRTYLYQQLRRMKRIFAAKTQEKPASRYHHFMSRYVQNFSAKQMLNFADYYSQFQCKLFLKR